MPTGKLNINSPEILLNSWIDMNTRIWSERGTANQDDMACYLLAKILNFGEDHGKLIPLFKWLNTRHAEDCLNLPEAQPAGGWIIERVQYLAYKMKDWPEDMIRDELDEFTSTFNEIFKYQLILSEPVYVRNHLIGTTYEELY